MTALLKCKWNNEIVFSIIMNKKLSCSFTLVQLPMAGGFLSYCLYSVIRMWYALCIFYIKEKEIHREYLNILHIKDILTEGKLMRIVKRALAIAAIVLTTFTASASLINVGGVVWDPDHGTDFSGVSGVIYQEVDIASGDLSGFGRVTTLNGLNTTNLCPGCELTFHFGGYNTTGNLFDAIDDEYTGGWMKFWVDNTSDASDSDPLLLTAENTGDDSGANSLWLSLEGHVISGIDTTFIGGSNNVGFPTGIGALDVVGGMAMSNIDTDSIFLPNQTFTDIVFGSTFTNFGLELGVDNIPVKAWGTGSADFHGESIPEPNTLAIFALGLIALAFGVRAKKV